MKLKEWTLISLFKCIAFSLIGLLVNQAIVNQVLVNQVTVRKTFRAVIDVFSLDVRETSNEWICLVLLHISFKFYLAYIMCYATIALYDRLFLRTFSTHFVDFILKIPLFNYLMLLFIFILWVFWASSFTRFVYVRCFQAPILSQFF